MGLPRPLAFRIAPSFNPLRMKRPSDILNGLNLKFLSSLYPGLLRKSMKHLCVHFRFPAWHASDGTQKNVPMPYRI